MTDAEILEFLATNINSAGKNYSDMTDEELAKLGPDDLKREIADFPNATVARVADSGGINYSDWNADQVDFNFMSTAAADNEKAGIEQDAKEFLAHNPYQHSFKWIWSMENVGGREAETVTFPLGLDSAGYKNATVELTGGKIYFITLENNKKTLVIKKQGRGDKQFENNFSHLVESISFEEGRALTQDGFCGSSDNSPCSEDADCETSGCSGQICGAKNRGGFSTCEYKECYSAQIFNLSCGCNEEKCQWK